MYEDDKNKTRIYKFGYSYGTFSQVNLFFIIPSDFPSEGVLKTEMFEKTNNHEDIFKELIRLIEKNKNKYISYQNSKKIIILFIINDSLGFEFYIDTLILSI
jgi:hypothetical protein